VSNSVAKTIWYCHHYAGSPSIGMSYRPYYLTQEFANAGHKAYVVSASFHHLLRTTEEQNNSVAFRLVDGVPFIYLKVRKYVGNGVKRFANMLDYAWGFRRYLKEIVAITGKPDIIIVSTSHPFHFPILFKIAKRFNAKLIFEVRDLWPLSLLELLKIPSWHPIIRWLARIERQAYRKSDYVVSLLSDAFPYMGTKGLQEKNFRVIPNGTSMELFRYPAALNTHTLNRVKSLQTQDTFLLAYAGAIGEPNALKYLIKAMAFIAKRELPIQCIILGDGNLKAELEKLIEQMQLNNVHFLASIPKYEIPAFLTEMHALYLGWNDTKLYQYGVSPNKVFDYMMAGKPIIESGGARTSLIEEAGCGIRCRPADPEDIANAIIQVYKMSVGTRKAMGELGVKVVEERFNYSTLAAQYMKLFA